ncbi:MAG TPA: hypothetical protein VK452_12445 [Dissulfurispiraceae bacterium]|nr:hypothetical protein [Dissulfurispiraceae bacterium]
MTDIIYRRAIKADYPALLALQKINLIGNLSSAEAEDGFLSVEMDEWQFEKINTGLGIAVAILDDVLSGYLCATSYSYSLHFPILRSMLSKLHELTIERKHPAAGNTFVYGPVCIAKSMRGTGLLTGLYGELKRIVAPHYRFCVLFISEKNRRSFNAHIKLGMKPLGMFEYNNDQFYILGAAI